MATGGISDYYLTPTLDQKQESQRSKLALALLQQGMDASPIKSWSQGAARIAQALMGGYMSGQQDRSDQAREDEMNNAIFKLPGMSDQAPAGAPAGARFASYSPPDASITAPPQAQPMGATPPPASYGANTTPTNTGDTIALPPANPLGRLNPQFRTNFADIRSAAADRGVNFNAPEVGSLGNVRTQDQQDALYAQGRTAPGPVVTGTRDSNHLTGNALDVVPQGGTTEKQIGQTLTDLTRNDPRFAGMRSGATFSNLYDPLHIEQGGQPTQVAGGVPRPDTAPAPQGPEIRAPLLTDQQKAEIQALWNNKATRPLAWQAYREYTKPKEQWRDLTSAERQAAGVPTGVPAQVNTVSGEKKFSQPQVSIANQAESSFEKEYGQGVAKEAIATRESGSKAVGNLQQIQMLRPLLENIQTGKFAPAGATIGAYMQGAGLDPKSFGIDPATPATAEAATALINKFALSGIGAQNGGIPANNFSEADRNFMVKTVPSLSNRPEANAILLEAREREANLAIQKANAWDDARAGGTSYEKFERQWRADVAKQNIFGDLADKVKALQSTPAQAPAQAAPTSPQKIRKYNPATGGFE